MKLNRSSIYNKKLLLLAIYLAITTIAVVAVWNRAAREKEVGIETFCDATIKYCVEQKCQIPFKRVKSGILNAYEFFEKLGYTGKYPVNIVFQPKVSVSWGDGNDKTELRVLGKYDEDEKTIYLTCWGEKWLDGRNDFKLDMTDEFYQSIVAHEMIHFLLNRYAKRKVNTILSEYVAYSGQLEILPEETIKVLAETYRLDAFEENDIDEYTLEADPGTFGVKSYLHFKSTGGSLVKRIIAGTFEETPRMWPPY